MNEQELREKVTISSVDHTETAWVRDIELKYEGKSYEIRLSWAYGEGYELEGVSDLPADVAADLDILHCALDDLSEEDLKAGGWRGGGF